MLHRIPPYRDPLQQVLSDALRRALELYRREASAGVSVEFECRLGTFSASRHTYAHPFPTHTCTPAVLDGHSATPFFFFAGVAQPTFTALHDALKTLGASMPPRSSTMLSVRATGKDRLEYAMNEACNRGRLLAITEKERVFFHDVRCPGWGADFRVSVSREQTLDAATWNPARWEAFTPSVSRLRQRKSVQIDPLFSVDMAMVRSFTDHSRFVQPWSPELQVPFISAPRVSFDVEVEVNIPALHRMVKQTGLVDSTPQRTALDLLMLLQFLAEKRE
ncbi:hypothetical protein TraAM80_08941 [Trypanosoma rangeli]|uniref:mRNA 5'-phosphatase n=1 Tax=Trypanosoma rangeli TaxID=5698 RepID=A0A3R7JXB6_TRYRA|nr:uncharacterized protein TraAM80_08941 [Trypanosoma rangeli]RNE98296.1 hypothetical protein TraAM80_08941 [Trypanosoma rangeli]|eukprot:RNE98296.1 hypothetical protein TraAM80_08941 [Trypanosoma rangeli]